MLWALIIGVIAFAGGLYLAGRFAPPLAPTRTGRIAARVVDVLVALAAAVLALNLVWVIEMARPFEWLEWQRAVAFAPSFAQALWASGLLLAAAAAVHLLAPGADEA